MARSRKRSDHRCRKPDDSQYRKVSTWAINTLVSNQANVATNIDDSLISPRGLTIRNNQLWVVDNLGDAVNVYDLVGNRLVAPIVLRNGVHNTAFHSAIVNNPGAGFSTPSILRNQGPADVLVASELGTVHALGQLSGPGREINASIPVINSRLSGVVHTYTGITLAPGFLYLADFAGKKVDVFDDQYAPVETQAFIDGDIADPIPVNYAPYNIVLIGELIYVAWAQQDSVVPYFPVSGPGLGFVSVFSVQGVPVGRLASRGVLNQPWSIIPAPIDCGFPLGSVLVANRGDGRINIFGPTGEFIGPMLNQSGTPLTITGLQAIYPQYCGGTNIIYFTSSNPTTNQAVIGCIVKYSTIDLLAC